MVPYYTHLCHMKTSQFRVPTHPNFLFLIDYFICSYYWMCHLHGDFNSSFYITTSIQLWFNYAIYTNKHPFEYCQSGFTRAARRGRPRQKWLFVVMLSPSVSLIKFMCFIIRQGTKSVVSESGLLRTAVAIHWNALVEVSPRYYLVQFGCSARPSWQFIHLHYFNRRLWSLIIMIMTDWSTDLETTRTTFAFAMLSNYNIAFIGFSPTFNRLILRQFLKYASLESTAKVNSFMKTKLNSGEYNESRLNEIQIVVE